jgi:5'-methylthioinosine phosphorylase
VGLLAIIGGSGFQTLPGFEVETREPVSTPYGPTSADLARGRLRGLELVFLPRHGPGHSIPPHRINYRANLWALADVGVDEIIALAAVGGIGAMHGPLTLSVPDQIIDYTYGRGHSVFDGGDDDELAHVDMTEPYCARLRTALLEAGRSAGLSVHDGGTYGVSQGPRLETAAEIRRLERDGCDLVGMTAMPEAALARELGLCYATLAFVVNWAAGKAEGPIGMDEIEANLALCRTDVERLLDAFVTTRAAAAPT